MAHGIIVNVPRPIDMYVAVNEQVLEATGGSTPPGMLVHIARETPVGFQVIEVWDSKQQCDDFQDTVLAPIIDRLSEGHAPDRRDITEEFQVRNLVAGQGLSAGSSL